jgi:hypothetical protein
LPARQTVACAFDSWRHHRPIFGVILPAPPLLAAPGFTHLGSGDGGVATADGDGDLEQLTHRRSVGARLSCHDARSRRAEDWASGSGVFDLAKGSRQAAFACSPFGRGHWRRHEPDFAPGARRNVFAAREMLAPPAARPAHGERGPAGTRILGSFGVSPGPLLPKVLPISGSAKGPCGFGPSHGASSRIRYRYSTIIFQYVRRNFPDN